MSQKRVIIICIHIVHLLKCTILNRLILYKWNVCRYTSKDKYIHCRQALMYDPFSQEMMTSIDVSEGILSNQTERNKYGERDYGEK